MPKVPSAIAAISRKTLAFPKSHHLRVLCTSPNSDPTSTTERDIPTKELIVMFSEAVRRFSKQPPDSSPPPPTSPRRPHPFDYTTLMKAWAEAGDVDRVLSLFRELKGRGLAPDVVCYTTVIDTLATANRNKEAFSVFEEMLAAQIAPDVVAFTILVKMFAWHLQQFDSAHKVIRLMVEFGCSPDVFTYTTIITGLSRAGRLEEALGYLDQMLEEGCRPNAYTYTPLIQAYCSNGRIGEAKMLLDTMNNVGTPPNAVTYNILVDALCKIGSFNEVEEHLKSSGSKGWKPDTITYSTYMDGLCKWGKADIAFRKLEAMLADGVYPNFVTLNILLDGLCRSSMAWEAKCLLERSAEWEWDVDVVNYNTVMNRLSKCGRKLAVLKLLTDMMKKGIHPNTRTISIVIHSLCRAGKIRMAKCIFNSTAYVPNVVTYTTLIHFFYVKRKLDEVHLLFHKMNMENVTPNLTIYNIMIDCFCREGKFLEAIDCFSRSLEDGFSPHLVGRLTHGLVRGGKHEEILSLSELISGHNAQN